MKRPIAFLSSALLSASALTQPVTCHVAYAGATRAFIIEPTPHQAPVQPLLEGASVVLEVINRLPPAPGAGVTVRTLGVQDGHLYLLHQASYWPHAATAGLHGFTGLQVIREPSRGNELVYWCETTLNRP